MRKAILIGVGLGLVTGAGLAWARWPRRGHDASVEQAGNGAFWTPDNVEAYPDDYLVACGRLAGDLLRLAELRSAQLAQVRPQLAQLRDQNAQRADQDDARLAELRRLSATADLANGWPIRWEGEPRDRSGAIAAGQALDERARSERRTAARCGSTLDSLAERSRNIGRARSRLAVQLGKCQAGRAALARGASLRLDPQLTAELHELMQPRWGDPATVPLDEPPPPALNESDLLQTRPSQ